MSRSVSIITVTNGAYFFVRLLVEQVRKHIGDRAYEIIAVDRGSNDGTSEWLAKQPDVRVIRKRNWFWSKKHRHGEDAEQAVGIAKYEHIVLLDSDAFPLTNDWLSLTIDQLDEDHRLAGAIFRDKHAGNPHGWYIHPHFMAFCKSDLHKLIVLRKTQGHDTDTGEEATVRVLADGKKIVGYPIEFCETFSVGHPRVPTVSGGVFHAWYVTRLLRKSDSVARETEGAVTYENYRKPLEEKLKRAYGVNY